MGLLTACTAARWVKSQRAKSAIQFNNLLTVAAGKYGATAEDIAYQYVRLFKLPVFPVIVRKPSADQLDK